MLTCITLVLLTFTVLSFTSIVPTIRYNHTPADGVTRYHGILLRDAAWGALELPAYRILEGEYGRNYAVSPRAWGNATTIRRADQSYDLKGIVGLSSAETGVTHPQDALTAGRWFIPGDIYSIILPDTVAAQLGVSTLDVGRATVAYAGNEYRVIGIIDSTKLNSAAMTDLDDESIAPADFQASQAKLSTSTSTAASGSKQPGFQQYIHMDAGQIAFIPYNTLINQGGTLRSVAVNFGSISTVSTELKDLMPRLDLNLYAGLDRNYRFSAVNSESSTGIGTVIVPLLIAALIVLSTMLSSVFERVREIEIFSSIGLTPGNIGMLFIAESLVFAVIGSVAGYLIGQGVAKLITMFNLLPGLTLNFSSTSAMGATIAVSGVVLLSTIYPARKASQVATPAVDRVWKLPTPGGDDWRIQLPFAITGNQAMGINGYLSEWLHSFVEQSVGDFLVQEIAASSSQYQYGKGYQLSAKVWLAPFDLGVSQLMRLETVPTDLEDVFEVVLYLHRVSGDVSNWQRVNRRFLNVVRRQFLIWRTLSAEERDRYLAMSAGPEDTASATAAPAL